MLQRWMTWPQKALGKLGGVDRRKQRSSSPFDPPLSVEGLEGDQFSTVPARRSRGSVAEGRSGATRFVALGGTALIIVVLFVVALAAVVHAYVLAG
jgi:hypothetical protein